MCMTKEDGRTPGPENQDAVSGQDTHSSDQMKADFNINDIYNQLNARFRQKVPLEVFTLKVGQVIDLRLGSLSNTLIKHEVDLPLYVVKRIIKAHPDLSKNLQWQNPSTLSYSQPKLVREEKPPK